MQGFDFIPVISPNYEEKIILTFMVVVVILASRWVISNIVFKHIENRQARYYWQKSISITSNALIIIFAARIWFEGVDSAATYLGLLSAGLAIALKDPIANLAGWIFIVIGKLFSLEDRIEIDNIKGDVADIRFFEFTLLEIGNWINADQPTGRIVHVPNSKVFLQPIYSYNRGFQYLWHEIGVMITFESNWKKTKEILLDILKHKQFNLDRPAQRSLRESSKKFMILYKNLAPEVYTTVLDSGIMFHMRFLCEPKKRRIATQLIWEQVLHQFSLNDDIDLAYPTTRFYNAQEGHNNYPPPPPPSLPK